MIGISHIAVITPDLDRFRAFYEDVVGLRTAIVLRASEPTGFRHAIISVSDTSIVHVFEQPGYDPAAQSVDSEMFTRGRLDHFGFMVGSVEELEAVRDRLVAVGASEGEIAPQGPVYSVRFSDPDGLEGEINAVRLGWDSSQEDQLQVEDEPDPDMYARLVAAGVR